MFEEYVELDEIKKQILYKKIKSWTEDTLTLEDGTVMEVYCSEQDCCASAGGTFKDIELDATITDVNIGKKDTVESDWGSESFADIVIYHNQNVIAKAECYADNGNGGYYYSICALKVKNIQCVVVDQ